MTVDIKDIINKYTKGEIKPLPISQQPIDVKYRKKAPQTVLLDRVMRECDKYLHTHPYAEGMPDHVSKIVQKTPSHVKALRSYGETFRRAGIYQQVIDGEYSQKKMRETALYYNLIIPLIEKKVKERIREAENNPDFYLLNKKEKEEMFRAATDIGQQEALEEAKNIIDKRTKTRRQQPKTNTNDVITVINK